MEASALFRLRLRGWGQWIWASIAARPHIFDVQYKYLMDGNLDPPYWTWSWYQAADTEVLWPAQETVMPPGQVCCHGCTLLHSVLVPRLVIVTATTSGLSRVNWKMMNSIDVFKTGINVNAMNTLPGQCSIFIIAWEYLPVVNFLSIVSHLLPSYFQISFL